MFGLGDPASSYATTNIALRVIGARKPHHHKVETHGGHNTNTVDILLEISFSPHTTKEKLHIKN
jgi:hypothetical protein